MADEQQPNPFAQALKGAKLRATLTVRDATPAELEAMKTAPGAVGQGPSHDRSSGK